MNEFRETSKPKKCLSVVGSVDGKPILCGEETYLEWAQYKEPIPVCKRHINRMREVSNRRSKKRVSDYVD